MNEHQTCHAKHKEALTLRPFWRVTISTNDENENLMIVPPLDESLTDKVSLFRVQRPAILDSASWGRPGRENWARIVDEIPSFVHDLKEFEIPLALRSGRFGIRSFQHPILTEALSQLSPELRLLELIDTEIFAEAPGAAEGDFPGTAAEVEQRLTMPDSNVRDAARRLLDWYQSCGTYLSRLATKRPDRVIRKINQGKAMYTIIHPRTPGRPRNRTTFFPEGFSLQTSTTSQL